MTPKLLIVIIAGLVSAGVVAGIVIYNFSNENTESNSNSLKILNYGYFFGYDSGNKPKTYIYLQLSNKLVYNDFIHIYYGSTDIARWWVNKTQAYRENISFPTNLLTNLNGSVNIEIFRNNQTLYSGTLDFENDIHFKISIQNITLAPLNYQYARIGTVRISISSNHPAYVDMIKFHIGNKTFDYYIDRIIYPQGCMLNLSDYTDSFFLKGQYDVKISVSYPTFPNSSKYQSFESVYNLSFECHNASVENVTLSYLDDSPYLTVNFADIVECPTNIELIENNDTPIYMCMISGGNGLTISFPKYHNFNASYTLILKDYFGNILQFYNFSLRSGPLLLVNHTEDLTYYDWENITNLYDVTVELENTGNARVFITNCNVTIEYSSNNTVVKTYTDDGLWIYQPIRAGDCGNVTLYPNVDLQSNETYTIILKFWGENDDVNFTVTYEIKT